MRKMGMPMGLIVGVLLIALFISPVSAAGCTIKVCKFDDKQVPLAGWTFTLTKDPNEQIPSTCALNPPAGITGTTDDTGCVVFDGPAHTGLFCNNKHIVVTESPQIGWENVAPVGGSTSTLCSFPVGQTVTTEIDFMNKFNPREVPEFPTVAVSFATLVGLGFVVNMLRNKNQ